MPLGRETSGTVFHAQIEQPNSTVADSPGTQTTLHQPQDSGHLT